jgi:hypothetical protein
MTIKYLKRYFMQKYILILSAFFCSSLYAESECRTIKPAPDAAIGKHVDLGNQLGCNLDIPDEEKFSKASCDQYSHCIDSQKLSADDMAKRKKDAVEKMAHEHGLKLLSQVEYGLNALIEHEKLAQYLAVVSKNSGRAVEVACPGRLVINKTDKCDPKLMYPCGNPA